MTASTSESTSIVDEKKPGLSLTAPRKKIYGRTMRIAIILGAFLLLCGGGYYLWRTLTGASDADNDIATAIVKKGDLEDTITATGILQPKAFVDVGTQVSGQLKRLLVDVGAVVKAKDLLAEIDPSVYLSKVDADRAQLRNQGAQLTDRQSQLVLAELQLTRQKNMMREDATTAEAVQSAEAAQRSAGAQVEAVKAQMQQTESTLRGDEANLSYTKIYAPISGTVVSQAVKQGQTLNANQQAPIVMRIADLSVMTVQAQVSEADVTKLQIGMDVYFTTLGSDTRRFYGKLRQIPPTPTVVNNVVLYDALFDVPNPKKTLMTQMTAQVFFVLASAKDAVYVPLTALHSIGAKGKDGAKHGAGREGRERGMDGEGVRNQFKSGRAVVKVVDENNKITERKVQVGVMTRVAAQILSGLEPGEKVVVGRKAPAKPAAAKSGGAMDANRGQGGRR